MPPFFQTQSSTKPSNTTNGSTSSLKRGCSSLNIDNICSACQKSFSAPQYLDRHQKLDCPTTKLELDALRYQAGELRQAKRRRLDQPPTPPPSIAFTATPTHSLKSSAEGQPPTPRGILTHVSFSSETAGDSPKATLPSQDRTNDDNVPPKRLPLGYFSSDWNSFGLRKRYYAHELPSHDPDAALTPADLYDSTHHKDIDPASNKNKPSTRPSGEKEPSTRPSGETELGARPSSEMEPSTRPSGEKEPSTHPSGETEPGTRPSGEKEASTQCSEKQSNGKPNKNNPYEPFPNPSSFELGEWFYGQGPQKSLKDFKALIEVLTGPDFSLDDVRGTKWTRVFQDLGKNREEINPKRSNWVDDTGWKTTDIKIEVPIHNRMKYGKGVETHVAGQLFHRSIVSIVEEKIRNAQDSRLFHYDGHELLWKPDPKSAAEFRIMSELYHSDAFLNAQKEVNHSPPPEIKDCPLPRVVVGLMFWSDATHVSTFSTCKVWPLYMLFANESKYRRAKDGIDLCNHVAYFDALSDSFKDYVTGRTQGKLPRDLLTHLNREMAHVQWEAILDDELINAIVVGLKIKCLDGEWRRFFIRIFTYSTDYPERVLMATIKARGDCPCVLCLVKKKNLNQMGTTEDMIFRDQHPRIDDDARRKSVLESREIIRGGIAVGGDRVVACLSNSDVPTVNAFSSRLGHTGFNIFSCLVVDLLHEFEIGVFKALFIHLIRILDASAPGSTLIHELDKRYRRVPTFNRTIRKFSANASSLRRRAARDYEDLLQCSIAVFDGLLAEPLNGLVLKLLFLNARWHALAKLRMQNEATIILLEQATTQLGDLYRQFVKDTDRIDTLERPNEAEKRTKAASKKAQQAIEGTTDMGKQNQQPAGRARAGGGKIQQAKKVTKATSKKAQQTKDGASSHHHPAAESTAQAARALSHSSQHHTIPFSDVGGVLPTQPYRVDDLGLLGAPTPAVQYVGRPHVQNHPPTFGPPPCYAPSYLPGPNYPYQTPPPQPNTYTELRHHHAQSRQPYIQVGLGQALSAASPATHWQTEGSTHRTPNSITYNTYTHPNAPLGYSQQYFPFVPHPGTQGSNVAITGPSHPPITYHHPRQWQHTTATYSYSPNNHTDARRSHEPHAIPSSTIGNSAGSVPIGSLGLPPPHIVPLIQPQAPQSRHALQPNETQAGVPSPQHALSTGDAGRPTIGSALPQPNIDEGGPFPSQGAPQSTGSEEPGMLPADSTGEPADASSANSRRGGRRVKKLNISTVKFHALGHYPKIIRHVGPTDLYSTEWGEYFHKSPKAWTKQTSRRYLRMELSRHERKRKRLRRIKDRILSGVTAKSQELREQQKASRDPNTHHFIGISKRVSVPLADFSQGGRFSSDPLSSGFTRSLKQHLLLRFIAKLVPDLAREDKSKELARFAAAQDWSRIVLKNDRVYSHQIMRIKYTTYDARRDEDIIHLDTAQCNIMLQDPTYSYKPKPNEPPGSPHPFRYCKVIAILHAEVGYMGEIGRIGPQFAYLPLEFLWVRWYRFHPGTTNFSLDQVELLRPDERGSHSFIDPSEVLRACHIIPRYCKGMGQGEGQSFLAQDKSDWKKYYINRFVDRDMFMRYEWGLAVGHTYTRSDAIAAMQSILPAVSTCAEAPSDPASASQQPQAPQEYDEPINSSTNPHTSDGEHGQACEEDGGDKDEDEDGESDDDNGYHSASTTDTDDSRTMWESDEELEREVELFGS